jgi:hypothetical protein
MAHLVEHHPKDIRPETAECADSFGDSSAFGFSSKTDNENAVGSRSHLEALRETYERGRVQNYQIVFLREFVKQSGEPGSDQVSGTVRA